MGNWKFQMGNVKAVKEREVRRKQKGMVVPGRVFGFWKDWDMFRIEEFRKKEKWIFGGNRDFKEEMNGDRNVRSGWLNREYCF